MEDWPPRAPPVHPIEQYWVLAFLLHVWVVLMFGTLQGGTARPGEGVWGSLTVALVGPPGQGEASSTAQEDGALAPQAQGRQGRADAALPDASVTAPSLPESGEAVANGAAEVATPEEPPAPPELAPPGAIDPPPQPVSPPPPAPALPEPPPAPVAAAMPQPTAVVLEPPVVPLSPMAQDVNETVPEPTTATMASTLPALSVPRQGEALVAAAAARFLPEIGQPLQRVPTAGRAPASAPVPAPVASVLAQASVAAPPAPAATAAALPASPASTPSTPAPPPVVMRQFAAEAMPALARGPAFNAALTPARAVARPPEVQALAAADRVGPARRPVVQGQPEATSAAAPAATGAALGAGPAQVSATAPTPPASSGKLILELPRGGAMAAQGVRGAVQLVPPPPERKSKLGEALDKAAKTDCREAYQKNGLLAVVPLVVDAVRDKGCQW